MVFKVSGYKPEQAVWTALVASKTLIAFEGSLTQTKGRHSKPKHIDLIQGNT